MRSFWPLRRSTRIGGTRLAGFHGLFEEDFGDPATPTPYPRVTPSRVGDALLPFRCPACRTIVREFSDARDRECFHDPQRGFYFCPCPDCRSRFYFNEDGIPLPSALPAGATVAPCKVDRGGKAIIEGSGGVLSIVLGAMAGGGYDGLDVLGGVTDGT